MKEQLYLNIYNYGTYYNPAWKHYNRSNAIVNCDRCYRSGIPVSVGWKEYDLCMNCVHIMESMAPKPQMTLTRMTQELFYPRIKDNEQYQATTNMMQRQFKPNPPILTKMGQTQFQPNFNPMMWKTGNINTFMEQTLYRRTNSDPRNLQYEVLTRDLRNDPKWKHLANDPRIPLIDPNKSKQPQKPKFIFNTTDSVPNSENPEDIMLNSFGL